MGALASALADADPGWTLALLHLAFALGSLAVIAWMVVRHLRSDWARLGCFVAIAVLINAAGMATFRALLPVVAILLYAPGRAARRGWGSAVATALWTLAGLFLSFDRFVTVGMSVAAVALAELMLRLRWRRRPREGLEHALRYGAALLGAALVLWGLLALVGIDLVDYVQGQRRLAEDYSVAMAVGWEVRIPATNVRGFLLVFAVLLLVPLARRSDPVATDVLWLAGALPSVLFAAVRSDQGHLIMAILPALCVLVLVAGGAVEGLLTGRRILAGTLAAVAILGWLGTYPEAITGSPGVLVDLYHVAAGDKRPDRDFDSPVGAARRWIERHRDEASCLGVSADFTVLHPLTGIRGPTELALRWSPRLKERLARRIEDADCRYFVYSVKSYEVPGQSWSWGADFLEVVRRYRPRQRIAGQLVVLERRDHPVTLRHQTLMDEQTTFAFPVPGQAEIPLGAEVAGTDLIRLRMTLRLPRWRAFLGGVPKMDWRFERDGEPVGPWRHLHHLSLGDAQPLWTSPDGEAAEWRWVTGQRPRRHRPADTLVIRASDPRAFSPDAAELVVHSIERFAPPPARQPEPARCQEEVDLLERLREGDAFVEFVAPSVSDVLFHLEPQPEDQPLAEVLFEVTPCPTTCFDVQVAVQASPEQSDGAVFEAHVLDAEQRPLLARFHVPAGGDTHPVQVSLEPWAGREVLLRLGTTYGEERAHDDVVVVAPRLTRCAARGRLADALSTGDARVVTGEVARSGADVIVDRGGATIAWTAPLVTDTCLVFGASAPGEGDAGPVYLAARIGDGGVENLLWEGEILPGAEPVEPPALALFDWVGREVEVIWELRPVSGGPGAPARLRAPSLVRCGAAR